MITDKNQIITLRGRLLEYNVLDKDACQASVSTPAINSHGIENATALICIEYDKAENKFYHTVDLFDEEGFVEHYHEDFYLYITSEEAEQIHKDLFKLFNSEVKLTKTAKELIRCYLTFGNNNLHLKDCGLSVRGTEVQYIIRQGDDLLLFYIYMADGSVLSSDELEYNEVTAILHKLQDVFPI